MISVKHLISVKKHGKAVFGFDSCFRRGGIDFSPILLEIKAKTARSNLRAVGSFGDCVCGFIAV